MVWLRSLAVIGKLDHACTEVAARTVFRRYALALLSPLSARLVQDAATGEDANLWILRAKLLATLSKAGDASVITDARRRVANDSGPATQKDNGLTTPPRTRMRRCSTNCWRAPPSPAILRKRAASIRCWPA